MQHPLCARLFAVPMKSSLALQKRSTDDASQGKKKKKKEKNEKKRWQLTKEEKYLLGQVIFPKRGKLNIIENTALYFIGLA